MSADTIFYKDNKCISLFIIIIVIRTKFLSTLRGSNNRELTVAKFLVRLHTISRIKALLSFNFKNVPKE